MRIFFLLILIFFSSFSFSQKIVYSEPDREDARDMQFEIIGKMSGNFLMYKAATTSHYICVFDAAMQQKEKIKIECINDKVFNVDFVVYNDYAWCFYQYQKKRIIYNMAVKIDATGKALGEPLQLDTTDSREVQNNKIYSYVNSTNKQQIMFYKVNTYEEKEHKITTFLYNSNLDLQKKSYYEIAMKERNSYLTGFEINNNGNFIFFKAIGTNTGDNINSLTLISKAPNDDEFKNVVLKKFDNVFLDEIKVKVENSTNKFFITSFYANKKRGDIQGLYISVYDANKEEEILATTTTFDDEFRKDAKGDAGIKQAFNNYFIKQLIPKKNGGFLFVAESEYVTNRNGMDNINRWDYFGNNSTIGNTGFYNFDNGLSMPWGRTWSNTINRYFADNIAIASFDSTGKIEWNNVAFKSQFDENSDAFISFGTFNSGNQIKFLYNSLERQEQILNEQAINADGQMIRSTTLKNLDLGHVFMPRYAKQVASKQIIVPCMNRTFLCFAKIDY